MVMSQPHIARRCTSLLSIIAADVAHATAFGPEARHLHDKLSELRTLLEELLTGRCQDEALDAALEGIEASLQSFAVASKRCCVQGPLETLLTAEELLHRLVDSCLHVRRGLAQLLQRGPQLPTVVRAQASLLSAQLNTCTVNFEILRRLHSVRFQLQEEAERVRLGLSGDGAFASQIHRLAATCTPQQLASDVAFLAQRSVDAEVDQQISVAYFLQLALGTVRALSAARGPEQPPEAAVSPRSPAAAAMGQPAGVADITGALAQLNTASTPPAGRVALLGSIWRALEGPERPQVVKALAANGGVTAMLHLLAVAGGAHGQRSGALRVMCALTAAQPACGGELVAARGAQVLVHLLGACLDAALQRAAVAARRQAVAEAAVVTVNLATRSPARKKGPGGAPGDGGPLVGEATGSPRAGHERAGGVSVGDPGRAQEENEEEVCLLAVALLRQLSVSHAAEVVAAGAVKALCRMAGLPGGGRLASTAATALSDLACDGPAAVQMLQERLLVSLATMRLSDLPSEAAAALACVAAILQHPARLQDQDTRHQDAAPPQQGDAQQLCAELGRACDATSLSVLLDLAVEAVAGGDTPAASSRCPAGVAPGLWQLLPLCVHSAESRSAVLRHVEAMRLLLVRVADGDATAAATLRRVANDDASKTAVARHLSKALAALPAGSKRPAAAALCLADVLRPASRDRSTLRWSGEACGEVEQCGLIQPLLAIAASPEPACRAAGLAVLHALAVYGTQSVRTALGAAGCVVCLVDAIKLEGVAMPGRPGEVLQLQSPICDPPCLSQAAAEALAALATASEALRQDVAMQLAAFLRSSSPHLAASACLALMALLDAAPAAGPPLVAAGLMPALVAHLTKPPPGPSFSAYTAAHSAAPAHASPVSRGRGEPGGAAAAAEPGAALELLQQRVVRLLWALCRGGGSAVEAAVAAGAPQALLLRVSATAVAALPLRVEAAAALAPLLKKSAAAREAVGSEGGLAALLQLARSGGGDGVGVAAPGEPSALWDEAMGALAALAAMHAPSRAEAARALRQMLLRGTAREATAAAMVVARLSSAAAGREAVLAEDLAEPLVRLLVTGDNRAKAAAANAVCHLAVPPTVQLPPCAAMPAGGAIRPRVVLVRAGAASALLALLRDAGETSAALSPVASAASPGGAQDSPGDAAVVAAAEALESLAGGEEGIQAIRSAGGVEVLKATVARGKRRLLPAAAAKAASAALLQCV